MEYLNFIANGFFAILGWEIGRFIYKRWSMKTFIKISEGDKSTITLEKKYISKNAWFIEFMKEKGYKEK